MLDVGLGLFAWNLIAFLVVLFLLRKFAWKPIISSLNERETKIADSIATADRVKAEMAQMLKEAKETRDKMVNEAKEQAKLEANKIVAEAQQAINNQKMAAITDVKNQVGALVVEVAEKVLRRELANKADQENYIKELSNAVKLN